MSTDGSVSTTSSGIRQFGLYRTIDARTEEFLRLSRKRQIRQGCACAAISTAITVTIVISIILIYEYSISYESNAKTSLRQNWLSLMNKSAEAFPFGANLNKAKINLEPTYLEFIPLILKTLKQNKYYDKIIADDSTQSSIYDNGEKPKNSYTKNIFSDSRNWMQIPTSRLYTIEYKTSPIVYFKYPTRDVDYFTKIRKIRDYQRIMNYVDKMINDKVTFTTTPMIKNAYSFHKKIAPLTYMSTTPMTKGVEYVTKGQTEHKKIQLLKNASTSKRTKSNCPCPKRLSRLLTKLIRSLQKIIPDFIGSEQMKACNANEFKTSKFVTQSLQHESSVAEFEETSKINQSNEILDIISSNFNKNNLTITESHNNSEDLVTTPNTSEFPKIQFMSNSNNDETMMQNTIPKPFYSVKPLYSNVDYTLIPLNKLIKRNFNKTQKATKNTFYTTTTRQFIEGTDANYYFPESTTKPMPKITSTTAKESSNIFTVGDLILLTRKLNNKTKSLHTYPTFGKTKHEDYYMTPDIVNNFRVLDAHSIELAKNNMLVVKNRKKNSKMDTKLDAFKKHTSQESIYNYEKEYDNNTWNILQKIGKLAFSTSMFENSTQEPNWTSIDSKSAEIVTEKENSEFDSEPMSSRTSVQSYLSNIQPEQQIKSEDVTLEEEIDQASSEEIIPEDNLKRLENLIHKINVSEIYNRTLAKKLEKEASKLDQYRLSQTEQHSDMSFKEAKSMIPEKRPTYLEIHRNNWKRDDEHQDYDTINLFY